MNIQINLDPTNPDEVGAAQALLAKLAGDTAPEETNTEEANDRPAKPPKGGKAKPAEEPPADDDTPPEEPEADADADKAAELRVLAKKLITKDRAAMAGILKKFAAGGLSEIPPFKIDKAIALIEAALEA